MKNYCLFALTLAIGNLLSLPARAETETIRLDNFRQEIDKVAKRIQEVVQGEQKSSISIGQFSPPAQHNANSGPGIEELLALSLESLEKGMVQKKAELSVRGAYDFVTIDDRIVVKLEMDIRDKQAKRVKEFVVELNSTSDIAALMQPTVELPPGGGKKERNEKLKESIESPKVFIAGPRVKASADSPFSIEVRARKADDNSPAKPRTPKAEDGEAFVDLQRGEEYEIVVHNGSDREVAANVTIDGFSVFAFSEERNKDGTPAYTHYVIAKGKSETIPGWYFRVAPPNNFHAFLVTENGKGASARAPRPAEGKVGVINVSFGFSGAPGTRSGSETGFGRPVSLKVEPVKRDVDPPHAFVSVRYTR